jgi:hypothetical protein
MFNGPYHWVELPSYGARAVIILNRAVMLYAGFGSIPTDAEFDVVNQVLSSLAVSEGPSWPALNANW